MKTSSEADGTPPLVASSEHSLTDLGAIGNRELSEDSCDELSGYNSREKSSSLCSSSSDSSSKSFEELNSNELDHMPENMDFVFNDDNTV